MDILRYGSDVLVLEPNELKQAVKEAFKKAYELY